MSGRDKPMNYTNSVFEHRGVKTTITQEELDAAGAAAGVNLLRMLEESIDRMLLVSGKETVDFPLKWRIENTLCESDKCIFVIQVERSM
jgi:hypothetical protein